MNKLIMKYFSGEKDKMVAKNIAAAFIIKGGALIISFLSLPAYIRYFNNQEVLGGWFTILSVLTWIITFDLGIGNGLRNKLAVALVRNDKTEVKQIISSAYLVIGAVVLIATLIGTIAFPFINWNLVFNIPEMVVSPAAMLFVVICVFLTIMLQFFLRLISFVLYALQKSSLNNLIVLASNVMMLAFILLFRSAETETNIKVLSVVYFLCINIPLLFATVLIFSTELKGCFPGFGFFNRLTARGILQLGGIFFWNQVMYMLITGTNSIFITKFIGPGSVVNYQIYYRIFSVMGMLFTLALTPMWSAITVAFEEKDNAWINKYYKLLNRLIVLVVLCEFLIVPLLQFLVNIWLGKNAVNINYTYAMIFAVFGSVFIYQSVLSTFACGIGKMKLQSFFYTAGIVVKFIFIYICVQFSSNWIIVVLSDIIIFLPYCLVQSIDLRKKFSII